MSYPDLADLAESWLVHLRVERKSPATLRIYRAGVKAYLTWCADNGQPAILDRNLLAAFTADLLDQGAEPATAQARHLAVRRFAKWLAAWRRVQPRVRRNPSMTSGLCAVWAG